MPVDNDSNFWYFFGLCAYLVCYIGCSAAAGVIDMLIGNALLRIHHPDNYTSNHNASIIGALGGLIGFFVLAGAQKMASNNPLHRFIAFVLIVAFGAFNGAVGTTIVKHAIHRDVGAIAVAGATLAGIVGEAVLLAAAIVIAFVALVVYGCGFTGSYLLRDRKMSEDAYEL